MYLLIRDHSAFLARFAWLLGGRFAPVNRWWKVAYPVAGMALVCMGACADSPSRSGAPESIPIPAETVVESIEAPDDASPPEGGGTPTQDDDHDGTIATWTLPATPPASEEDVVPEEDPSPIPEPGGVPEIVSSTDGEEEVPDTVEDHRPNRVETEPEVAGDRLLPATDILASGSYRPDIDVRFDDGEIHATVTGSIGPDRRLVYTVHASEGKSLVAALDARQGVWIDLRLGEQVIVSEAEQSQRVEATLPSGGPWRLGVVSTAEDFNDFALTIRIVSPEPEPESESEPAAQSSKPVARRPSIATGDVVYLTFDDGPDPRNTPRILDILARHGARATFFVVGKLVESHPDLLQRIVSEGHTVANHTWNHENLARLSREDFDETIGRTQEILGDHATGCLRPPYAGTDRNTRPWAAEHGLEVHLWSVSANDWLGLDAEAIADRITTQVTHGSVVLMHDGGGNRPATVRGLEIILERLSELQLRYEPLCT